MAVFLQNFELTLEPNNYILQRKEPLTLKPGGLKMRAKFRNNLTSQALERRLTGSSTNPELPSKQKDILTDDQNVGVLNDNFAWLEYWYLQGMGLECLGSLPSDHPVVIVAASYGDEPPYDAERLVSWILTRQEIGKEFQRVSHAVFSCSNSEWVTSFHKIPMLVETRLEELGAQRLAELGKTTVSTGAAFTDFEVREDAIIWPALKEPYGTSGVGDREKQPERYERFTKVHLEVKLPKGMKYQTGDSLVVLPFNPPEAVQCVMRSLGLTRDSYFEITSNSPVSLLVDVYASWRSFGFNILKLADIADRDKTIELLGCPAGDSFNKEIVDKKMPTLNLLAALPIPPCLFLSMLRPMIIRQCRCIYSISSSPLENPDNATVTFSILREPSLSGNRLHIGATTSYLGRLGENDSLRPTL
ncbi:unnamed protein product [Clonostachys rhizophaga]|uniref:Flavodoxin-like domain-containing protein n=1 Tax=Clonostachys rhizophaga TaxID=160324 RepID=A0A9N9VAL1_9HYPO|nr:unnamed protein product [Clonostachys rhizophaga]